MVALVAVLVAAGCTGTNAGGQDTSQGNLRAHFEYKESWGPTLGCYGKVTGYVYNTGNQPMDNVQLVFNLIDTSTGTIRDSRPLGIGMLDAGQSRTYATILDGDCTRDYRVEVVWSK